MVLRKFAMAPDSNLTTPEAMSSEVHSTSPAFSTSRGSRWA